MKERLEVKRAELEETFAKGQQILAAQEAAVRETKLKLEHLRGALTVLDELLVSCQE